MSFEMNVVIGVSMAGLLLVSGLWALKSGDWRTLITVATGLAAFAFLLNRLFGFPATVAAMGTREDLALLAALYLCMLTGMFAQYAYRHFERTRRHRTKWDWGLFIAPIFASPIVFVPLATSCISAGLDLKALTTVKFMIFFVAFQNGFFWKEFFDLKRKEAASPN
jgi:cytochrome bd-type quinol oxidase subunit 2